MRHRTLETLEDVKQWIAEHGGRSDAYWDAQHKHNNDQEKLQRARHAQVSTDLAVQSKRTTVIEKRMILLCALSLLGGTAGGALGQFLQTIGGAG